MASPIAGIPLSLNPCCVDQNGTCGLSLPSIPGLTGGGTTSGSSCSPPAQPFPACPSTSIPGFGSLQGCCTNNDCGIIGFGICVDTAMAASNPMFGSFIMGLTAQHCDGTPIVTGTGGDTGTGGSTGSAGTSGGGTTGSAGAVGAGGAVGGAAGAGASGSSGAAGSGGGGGSSGAAGTTAASGAGGAP